MKRPTTIAAQACRTFTAEVLITASEVTGELVVVATGALVEEGGLVGDPDVICVGAPVTAVVGVPVVLSFEGDSVTGLVVGERLALVGEAVIGIPVVGDKVAGVADAGFIARITATMAAIIKDFICILGRPWG